MQSIMDLECGNIALHVFTNVYHKNLSFKLTVKVAEKANYKLTFKSPLPFYPHCPTCPLAQIPV